MGDGGAEGDRGREGVGVGVDDFVAALFAFAWGVERGLARVGEGVRGGREGGREKGKSGGVV